MRRRTALIAGLPVAALGAIAAIVVASGGETGDPAAAGHRGGTEVVQRRTLVERALLDGTLGYGSTRAAMDRLGGTITWLPSPGAVIRPGRRLFAVDGEPVILMDGTVPAWRTLASGVSDGADVRQLERNLAALGYTPGTVDDDFSASTAAAVRRWQDALGLAETGSVELGRVVFLPGERRIASVDTSLGGTGGGSSPASWDGGDGAGTTPAVWDGATPAYAYADTSGETATTPPADGTTPTTPATTPTTPTTPKTTPTTPSTTPATPRTTPTAPTTPTTPRTTPSAPGGDGGSGSPTGGDGGDGGTGGGAATKVLSTTSTARVVTADLDAADQGLARVGSRAVITLPNGRRMAGRVVRVGTVATASDGESGEPGEGASDPTLPLTIRLRSARATGGLDQAPVSVELARTTRRDVLAVPVTALIAQAGGGYAVQVLRAGGTAVEVPVQPGLFADGWVELADGDVREGDRVEVPE